MSAGVMTRKEVAAALGITPRTLSEKVARGITPRTLSEKVARGIIPLHPVALSDYRQLYLRADVERVLSGQRRGSRSTLAGRGESTAQGIGETAVALTSHGAAVAPGVPVRGSTSPRSANLR